ncbi:MAG: amidohydrolase family protein [Bacteroidales bacterium]|nr:amidohydrolase family protein [Bacteroidales bacterium]
MKGILRLHDSHIHIGQFRELYNQPQDVFDFLTSVGIEKIAVSSTTTCAGRMDLVASEMKEIVKIGGDRVLPVLWINTEWLRDNSIDFLLDCGVNWQCLKVHGLSQDWHSDPTLLEMVVTMAREMHLPLLLHTGGCPESDAGHYMDVIKRNPDVNFILAHSRPIDQTIHILRNCDNAWADTAFSPFEDIKKMVIAGVSDRILWGTDYPMHNIFYKGSDIKKLYTDMIQQLQHAVPCDTFEKITFRNFETLFQI